MHAFKDTQVKNKSLADYSKHMKILVVDDEEVTRDSLKEFLITEGHECRIAANGVDALEQLKDFSPDAIITDLNMPQMSGLDFVRNISSDRDRNNYSIVMVTGHITPNEEKSSTRHGVSKILEKPIKVDEIRQFLDNLSK